MTANWNKTVKKTRPVGRDPRWRAVLARDGDKDGTFVYAVKTTGIYCRPSCGVRRPLPENVVFFATAGEAEKAGFRACKRCEPNGPTMEGQRAELIAGVCRRIEESETPPALRELAEWAGMSACHLHRMFKSVVGITPRAYAAEVRARSLRRALPGAATVTEAGYRAGYGSGGRLYAASNGRLGMTPGAFRRGGENAVILYGVTKCSLGRLLAAVSARGVCAISLGDSGGALIRELRSQFPRARFRRGDETFDAVLSEIVALIEAPGKKSRLPLDIRGTAFQQRVWAALAAIPPGKTASYSEIARRIGSPAAARAVAAACAANRLAVAVPCHRAVRSDGDLAGYRWEVDRKRELLEREKTSTVPARDRGMK